MNNEYQQLNPQEEKIFQAAEHGNAEAIHNLLHEIKPEDWAATMQHLNKYSDEHFIGPSILGKLGFDARHEEWAYRGGKNPVKTDPNELSVSVGLYPSGLSLHETVNLKTGEQVGEAKYWGSKTLDLSSYYSDKPVRR